MNRVNDSAERLRKECRVLPKEGKLRRRGIQFTGARASVGFQYDVILFLNSELRIPQCTSMREVGLGHFQIAIRSETVNGDWRRTLRIYTTVYWSCVEWVNARGRVRRFELIWVNGGTQRFDLIKIEH